MNYEEAKERFENFGTFCDDYNEACDGDCEKCSDMEDRILEALEKQIPKKPIESDREIRYCEVWKCPRCGFEWSSRVVDFCYKCGQRIDYSEVE